MICSRGKDVAGEEHRDVAGKLRKLNSNFPRNSISYKPRSP